MTVPIDTQKTWVFRFDNLVPNETPLKFEEKEGAVSFSIPLDESKILTIKLVGIKTFGMEGRYAIMQQEKQLCAGEVTFQTIEEGKRYKGVPQGMLSRSVWCLERI